METGTQLHMLWPWRQRPAPEPVALDAGLALRTYLEGDAEGYLDLIERVGWGRWERDRFRSYLHRTLPDGFFFVVDEETGRIVATAQALHGGTDQHPFGGELGWVAADPDYQGRKLGRAVVAAVTARFLAAGYRRIYLRTEDFRLPALKTYLALGYEPLLYAPAMPGRWRAVCAQLDWPFTPEEWPRE